MSFYFFKIGWMRIRTLKNQVEFWIFRLRIIPEGNF